MQSRAKTIIGIAIITDNMLLSRRVHIGLWPLAACHGQVAGIEDALMSMSAFHPGFIDPN